MMNDAWVYTLFPAAAAVVGAAAATVVRPRATVTSAIQRFAAGVVFAAAAAEILPDVMRGSVVATIVGSLVGIAVMLLVKQIGRLANGQIGLLAMIGVDILIDGLVLGISFNAGVKAGLLLTLALTIEILFVGLTVAAELAEAALPRLAIIAITAGLAILLPVGALLAVPVATMPPAVTAGFLAFGLIALLYLVTEELLVEAHETPDTSWITAAFFIGFLTIIVIEGATR